jgi:ribosomal protein S18 acetylase RimI-like enzyme
MMSEVRRWSKVDVLVREVTENDFKEISALQYEIDSYHSQALPQIFKAVKDARSREMLAKDIADENIAMFVAERAGKVIGLVHAFIEEAPDFPVMVKRRYVSVIEIIVKEEFRGAHVGLELMNKVEHWALDNGISTIELNIWDFNEPALAFYEKLGYAVARRGLWKTIQ